MSVFSKLSFVRIFPTHAFKGYSKKAGDSAPPPCACWDNSASKVSRRVSIACMCFTITDYDQAARLQAQVCVFTAALNLLLANQAQRRGSIHRLLPLLTSAKLGLLCGRALQQADLSWMWPHKGAQSECNELSAHYTDLSAFDMSSGSQSERGRREGEVRGKTVTHFLNCNEFDPQLVLGVCVQ